MKSGPETTKPELFHPNRRRIRIVHLIPTLHSGGAEGMLARLAMNASSESFEHEVITIAGEGPWVAVLRNAGVTVHTLGLRKNPSSALKIKKLVSLIRSIKPDVMMTWMYHASLMGGFVSRIARVPLIWNLRTTDPASLSPSTRRVSLLCARMSSFVPKSIVCCGEAAREAHIRHRYDSRRMSVIHNGFDTTVYSASAELRKMFRREIDVDDETFVVGMVARYHPVKDHDTFISAASHFAERHPDAVFVLCGDGADDANQSLVESLAHRGLRSRFRLLGVRRDLPTVYSGLDLASLTSINEGLPNVVAEAMACEIPCVATDVGDTRLLIGETGSVVPIRRPDLVAEAWHEIAVLSEAQRVSLGQRARQRIMTQFSLEYSIGQYEALFRQLAKHDSADSRRDDILCGEDT